MHNTSYKTGPLSTIFKPVLDEIVNEINKVENFSNRPAANILETNDHYSIHLFAPGYEKQDFKLELSEGKLTISSEKSESTTAYKMEEYKFRAFTRSFILPKNLDETQVSAVYENGILKVVLHKVAQAKPRTITID